MLSETKGVQSGQVQRSDPEHTFLFGKNKGNNQRSSKNIFELETCEIFFHK